MRFLKAIIILVGLICVAYSAYNNFLFLTKDSLTTQDWYWNMITAITVDMIKSLVAVLIPMLWVGRYYKSVIFSLSLFIGGTVVSLYSAYQIKLEQQVKVSAYKQKVLDDQNKIKKRWLDADKAAKPYKTVADVAAVRRQLTVAIDQISKTRVWGSSGKCMNATVQKSINMCAKVNSLRLDLDKAEKKAVVMAELAAATVAVSKLPPAMPELTRPETQHMMAVIFALVLEISSSLILPLATIDFNKIKTAHATQKERKSRKPAQDRGVPDEVLWIEAMRAAATDERHAKIVFDEDGLMKAPYKSLTEIWDIKSASTAGTRINRLVKLGYLEEIGEKKNKRYRVLEMA